MVTRNQLLNGIADLLILHLLSEKDKYGYEITQEITQLSNNLLSISQNTIYTAIYKLESEKMISEYPCLVGKKRTRVYYHLESAGRTYLNELQNNYFKTIQGVQLVLNQPTKREEGIIFE